MDRSETKLGVGSDIMPLDNISCSTIYSTLSWLRHATDIPMIICCLVNRKIFEGVLDIKINFDSSLVYDLRVIVSAMEYFKFK